VNESRATLSTTELVHEAFLKLAGDSEADWEGRAHFFGAASRAMRQVLVDFARRRTATKRGGGMERVSLGEGDAALEIELDEILALDEALDQLDAVVSSTSANPNSRRGRPRHYEGGHALAGEGAHDVGVRDDSLRQHALGAAGDLLRRRRRGVEPGDDGPGTPGGAKWMCACVTSSMFATRSL
jgi:ECF sigma factor